MALALLLATGLPSKSTTTWDGYPGKNRDARHGAAPLFARQEPFPDR